MRGKVDFKGTKDGIVLYIKGDLSFDWIQILVQRKLKLARHFFEGAHIIGSSGYLFTEEQEAMLAQLIQAQSGMKVLNLEPYDFKRDPILKGSKWDGVPTVQAEPVAEKQRVVTGRAEHSVWGEVEPTTVATMDVADQIQKPLAIQNDEDQGIEATVTPKEDQPQTQTCEPSSEEEPLETEEVAEGVDIIVNPDETNSSEASDEEIQVDDEVEMSSVSEVETEEDELTDNVESFAYGLSASHEESSVFVSDTIFHRGTLRSGRRIDSKGNIVVLGDVNPGAELSARGNIIVMGNMRGLAHAGAEGNEDAFVAAIRLMPTQLRIHKVISRPPDDPEKVGHNDPQYPEIAYIKDGQIIIEPYL